MPLNTKPTIPTHLSKRQVQAPQRRAAAIRSRRPQQHAAQLGSHAAVAELGAVCQGQRFQAGAVLCYRLQRDGWKKLVVSTCAASWRCSCNAAERHGNWNLLSSHLHSGVPHSSSATLPNNSSRAAMIPQLSLPHLQPRISHSRHPRQAQAAQAVPAWRSARQRGVRWAAAAAASEIDVGPQVGAGLHSGAPCSGHTCGCTRDRGVLP